MTTQPVKARYAPQAKIPRKTRPAVIAGLIVIGVTFVGFGGWAAVAELSSAAIAPGMVMADSNRKSVQHLEGGIVKEILVRDGDIVKAGDVLIRLDETRERSTLQIQQDSLDRWLATEARLLAERNNQEEVFFPETLRERTGDADIAAMMEGELSLFEARRQAVRGQIEIYQQRIQQVNEQISGLRGLVQSYSTQSDLILEELSGLQDLLQKGFAEKPRVLALQREATRLEGLRAEQLAEIARAQEQISEARLQIIQIQKDFREEVENQLSEARAQIRDLQERVTAADFTLANTDIAAPDDGFVVDLQVHAPGAVIQPGMTLLDIVPVDDELVIEARVNPTDVDNIELGARSEVRITAFSARTTPILEGELFYVSADSMEDERTGEFFFEARVRVPEDQKQFLGEDKQLTPGMPAEVMIHTGARTALDYVVQPLRDSFRRAWREE